MDSKQKGLIMYKMLKQDDVVQVYIAPLRSRFQYPRDITLKGMKIKDLIKAYRTEQERKAVESALRYVDNSLQQNPRYASFYVDRYDRRMEINLKRNWSHWNV
jgi:hypothetical protein